jgi:cytohesin
MVKRVLRPAGMASVTRRLRFRGPRRCSLRLCPQRASCCMLPLTRSALPLPPHCLQGIEYLERHSLLRHEPAEVAGFLHAPALPDGRGCSEAVSKQRIGEYLGHAGKDEASRRFHQQLLEEYTKRFDFRGRTLVSALRLFLSSFRLPGEAQVIDRIMQGFAASYVRDNPNAFASKDAAYILAFGSIMLNTDLHREEVKRKMGLEQFVGNMRGIDAGHDVDRAILERIYKDIAATPLASDVDYYDVVTFFAPAKQGWLRKRCTGAVARWKRRYFLLTDGCLYYFLAPQHVSVAEPRLILPLDNVNIVPRGSDGLAIVPMAGSSLKSAKREDNGTMRRGLHTDEFLLRASSPAERDGWVTALTMHLAHTPLARMNRGRVAGAAASAGANGASVAAVDVNAQPQQPQQQASVAVSVSPSAESAATSLLSQTESSYSLAPIALPSHESSAMQIGVAAASTGGSSGSGGGVHAAATPPATALTAVPASRQSSTGSAATAPAPAIRVGASPRASHSRSGSVGVAPASASVSAPHTGTHTHAAVSTASSAPSSGRASASASVAASSLGPPSAVHARPIQPSPSSEQLLLSGRIDSDASAWRPVHSGGAAATLGPQRPSAAPSATAFTALTVDQTRNLLQLAAAAMAAASASADDQGSFVDTASELSSVDGDEYVDGEGEGEGGDGGDGGVPYDLSGSASIDPDAGISASGSAGPTPFLTPPRSVTRAVSSEVSGASLVAGQGLHSHTGSAHGSSTSGPSASAHRAFTHTFAQDSGASGSANTVLAPLVRPIPSLTLPPPPATPKVRTLQPPANHGGDKGASSSTPGVSKYTEKGKIISMSSGPASTAATSAASLSAIDAAAAHANRPREGSDELLMGHALPPPRVPTGAASSGHGAGSGMSMSASGTGVAAAALKQAVLNAAAPRDLYQKLANAMSPGSGDAYGSLLQSPQEALPARRGSAGPHASASHAHTAALSSSSANRGYKAQHSADQLSDDEDEEDDARILQQENRDRYDDGSLGAHKRTASSHRSSFVDAANPPAGPAALGARLQRSALGVADSPSFSQLDSVDERAPVADSALK